MTSPPCPPTNSSWECLLWASFQCWFFGFIFLCNISRLPFCPCLFSGHLKVLVFIFKTPPSISYSWTFFNYHRPCWVLGPQQETGCFPGSRSFWGDWGEVHSGHMQLGVLDPPSGLHTAHQLTCLTETPILPLGKRYFQILYYFSKQHFGSSVFIFEGILLVSLLFQEAWGR